MGPIKPSNLKNAKKSTVLTKDLMSKILFHVDENGIWLKNKQSEDFQQKLKKHSIERRKKIAVFVKNSRNNGTPANGDIANVKTISGLLTKDECRSLLRAIVPQLSKKPIKSVTNSPKDADIRSCTIYRLDNRFKNKGLCDTDLFQQFFEKIHTYARAFILDHMSKSSLNTFDVLYGNRKPRYCFASFYSKGTKQGIPSHRDQVSFLSIVIALKGDDKEVIDNCLRVSNFWIHVKENSKQIKFGNGDGVIFERLYHSIAPISNRVNNRVTINVFY